MPLSLPFWIRIVPEAAGIRPWTQIRVKALAVNRSSDRVQSAMNSPSRISCAEVLGPVLARCGGEFRMSATGLLPPTTLR
jgi:hypothetical protein